MLLIIYNKKAFPKLRMKLCALKSKVLFVKKIKKISEKKSVAIGWQLTFSRL